MWKWLCSWFARKPQYTELDADEDLEMQNQILLDVSMSRVLDLTSNHTFLEEAKVEAFTKGAVPTLPFSTGGLNERDVQLR